ncbi:FMN-dependent NADH-azoreductase [Mesomycoplasma neurolyticum]|uniref:FMN dependent NADH:quinone oxidoreductase n=1 Tax=Mesomycoplasma neurolyticum TaxID=2120 RepID=A0A449A5F7_9BACT|nr:FMN-dependent NADH-azoreductase [Mesomycoplasma neurolyticum]VEU59454.1 FMN-dependent NADH-azoreductase [Mesomycoplasma neurolyticum]
MKVLVLKGSIIAEENSVSRQLTNKFVELYKKINPDHEIIEMDLSNESFSSQPLTAKNFATFWKDVNADKYIDLLKSVDKVILSTPMINFNMSAPVKNFMDTISVADKTFSYKYSKKGEAIGLLDHLKVQILATQGAPIDWYPFGNVSENLKGVWKFLGAKEVAILKIASTKVPPFSTLSIDEKINSHIKEIEKAVKEF